MTNHNITANNNVTPNPMRKLIIGFTAIIILANFAACDNIADVDRSQIPKDTTAPQDQADATVPTDDATIVQPDDKDAGGETYTGVNFELPKGWYTQEGDTSLMNIYRDETDPIFEYRTSSKIAWDFPFKGTDEDALKVVCPSEYYTDGKCAYQKSEGYEVKELTVEDTTVYVNTSQGGLGSDQAWSNRITFEKNGVVYEATFMGFYIDKYMEELKTIIGSIEPIK